MLKDAGFVEASFLGWTGYHTSPFTEGALIVAQKPVMTKQRARD
jgi:hypothetical protein